MPRPWPLSDRGTSPGAHSIKIQTVHKNLDLTNLALSLPTILSLANLMQTKITIGCPTRPRSGFQLDAVSIAREARFGVR